MGNCVPREVRAVAGLEVTCEQLLAKNVEVIHITPNGSQKLCLCNGVLQAWQDQFHTMSLPLDLVGGSKRQLV